MAYRGRSYETYGGSSGNRAKSQATPRNIITSEGVRNGAYYNGYSSKEASAFQADYERNGRRNPKTRKLAEQGEMIAINNMINGRAPETRPETYRPQVYYNPLTGYAEVGISGRSAYEQLDSRARQADRMRAGAVIGLTGGSNRDMADYISSQAYVKEVNDTMDLLRRPRYIMPGPSRYDLVPVMCRRKPTIDDMITINIANDLVKNLFR